MVQLKGINRVILFPAVGGWMAQVKIYFPVEQRENFRTVKTTTLVAPTLEKMFHALQTKAKDLGVSSEIESRTAVW